MTDSEIKHIANLAGLKISVQNSLIEIKQIFRLSDKSTLGILFFLCGGILLTLAPFIKTSGTTTKILGTTIGLLLSGLSIWAIMRQVADGLKVTDSHIVIRRNLKQQTIPLNGNMKIEMQTTVIKIRRSGSMGSDFIVVTHYLHDHHNQYPILKFQMASSYSTQAIKLGNEITHMLNKQIR